MTDREISSSSVLSNRVFFFFLRRHRHQEYIFMTHKYYIFSDESKTTSQSKAHQVTLIRIFFKLKLSTN